MVTAISNAPARTNPLDGIGTRVNERNSLTCLQSAGMDFDVALEPVPNALTIRRQAQQLQNADPTEVAAFLRRLGDGDYSVMGAPKVVKGKKGQDDTLADPEARYFQVVRTDTGDVLGQVESRYAPQQNRDIFRCADELREDGWNIVRAATLDKGARCFMTLEADHSKDINVVGDIVRLRIIIHTSHDGKFATTMTVVPLRLWCTNGCSAPIPGFDFSWAIRHTVRGEEKLMDASEMIGKAGQYFNAFERIATTLAQTKVTDPHAETIIKTTKGLDNDDSKQALAKRESILSGFRGLQPGGDTEAMRNTAWGLFQAGCDVADHGEDSRVRVTAGNTEADQRFKQAFGGAGRTLKFNLFDRIAGDTDLGLDLKAIATAN